MKYVLLLSGKINSGKNQYAEFLTEEFEKRNLKVTHDLFAKTLKDNCAEDFMGMGQVLHDTIESVKATIGVHFDTSHGSIPLSVMNSVFDSLDNLKFKKENFYEEKTDITRALLQIYGTNIFRNRVEDKYWVNSFVERVNNDEESDVVIVTDVRFPNEIQDMYDMVDDAIIIPIRINRGLNRESTKHQHPSETALDDFSMWEFIVDNNGPLNQLKDSSVVVVNNILTADYSAKR